MNPVQGRIGDLPFASLQTLLVQGRLSVRTGPLTVRVQTQLPDVARSLHVLYADHPYVVDADFVDFSTAVSTPWNLRRWFKPQAVFDVDGETPFEPLPRDQAPAFFEWGLNWSVAASCHQWLTVHAASLERGGRSVILPAPPGSGKSTLCAGLALRNWRLLSDELTLIDHNSLAMHALARPINLKNASIGVIKAYEPNAVWGPETYDTAKGRVTHLKPPVQAVERMLETAQPGWIVFPRYQAGAEPLLTPRGKAATFAAFVENAFNYSILGETGFDVVGRLISQCDCYDFVYSRLDDAIEVFDWLASS